MRGLTNMSIRGHLTLIVLIAVIPTFLLIVHTAGEQHRQSLVEAERRAYSLVDELAESQARLVTGTRQMLGTLAELQQVRFLDSAECNRIFASLLTRFPHYNTIQAAGPDGLVFASALPLSGPLSIADRKYFRDAVQTRQFAPGEFNVGRATHRPTLNFAQPVLAADGTVAAVLQAGISLDSLAAAFDPIRLPKGASVVVTDHSGTILYRSTKHDSAIGVPDDPELFRLMQSSSDRGILPHEGAGLFPALVVYGKVRPAAGAPPHMFIRVTMPEELLYGPSIRSFLRNLLLFALAFFLTLALARRLGKQNIASPIEQLAAVSRRLAAGDLSARMAMPAGKNEIGLVAHAFDDMAQALVAREKERDLALDELALLTQQALDEKARTDAVIAAIGDGISIQDLDFRILYQNERQKEMIGNNLGMLCYEAYEQRSSVCEGCPVALAFTDRLVHTTERSATRADGSTLHVEITASPVRDVHGNIIAGVEVVRDVTQRKAIEHQLQVTNQALVKSNRELQDFAYITSHDLREPLRTIKSFIQLFQQRYRGKLDGAADEFIGFIVDGAARMQSLIDDLLLYARVDSQGKPLVPVDSAVSCRKALANLTTTLAESGATVTTSDLPIVLGDEIQLIQLFQNLFGNAVKYRSEAPVAISVGYRQDGLLWHFTVTDNGIGIDRNDYERIFGIFEKLHPREQYEGTGIGLAICKKIVDRHGGRIWVDSVPGQGSTFHFTLRGAQS